MKDSTRRVLDFLRLRGVDGATEADIQAATTIRSGAQRVHELRRDGFDIESVREYTAIGAPIARYYLREARPVAVPMTGTQESWL